MVEMRRGTPYRVLKAETIDLDCIVRSLSESGAAVEVTGQAGISERLILMVDADDLHPPCHVRGRKRYRSAWYLSRKTSHHAMPQMSVEGLKPHDNRD